MHDLDTRRPTFRSIILALTVSLLCFHEGARAEVLLVLDFETSGVAFNHSGTIVYVSDPRSRRVVAVDLPSAEISGEQSVSGVPRRMALTPDGTKMAVTVDTFDEYSGLLADFTLPAFSAPLEIPLEVKPVDVATTDYGAYFVFGTYGREGRLLSLDAGAGETVSTLSRLGSEMLIALHPGQESLFLSDDRSRSRGDLEHYTIDPLTLEVTLFTRAERFGEVSIHPDGNYVIAASTIFSLSDDRRQNLRPLGQIEAPSVIKGAFQGRRSALFTAGLDEVCYLNSDTLEALQCTPVPYRPQAVAATDDALYVVTSSNGQTLVHSLPNPAIGAESNEAPQAAMSWSPENPTTHQPVVFEATGSLDPDDTAGGVEFRWDWESDGTFDTEHSRSPNDASISFNTAGTKIVTLRVRDAYGAIDEVTHWVNVTPHPDSRPSSIRYEIQAKHRGLAADPNRPHLYLAAETGQRLLKVNLETGFLEEEFKFALDPSPVTISADGRWMYVGLLTRPHGQWNETEDRIARIAEFDLISGVQTREFEINEDPWSLAVTNDGILFVSSGSIFPSLLRSYDVGTITPLGVATVEERSNLRLSPSEDFLYVAGSRALRRFTVDMTEGVGARTRFDNTFPGRDIFIHPEGEYFIGTNAWVFEFHRVTAPNMLEKIGDTCRYALFDSEKHRFVRIPGDLSTVVVHDDRTFEELWRLHVPFLSPWRLYSWEDSFFAIGARHNESYLAKLTIPDGPRPKFHRGDASTNGVIDLTDAIVILGALFLGEAPPSCREAANTNNDDTIDLSDVTYLLGYLFLGTDPPPLPGPPPMPCGPDPDLIGSPADVGCLDFDACSPHEP